MSRIGKKPVTIPKGVDITLDGLALKVKGPNGELDLDVHPEMLLEMEDGELRVEHLDRDLAIVLHVVSEVDGRHPTGTDLTFDRVAVGKGSRETRKDVGQSTRGGPCGEVREVNSSKARKIE